ncbi:uncharacterized protein LOC115251830 [Xyrichtys novacula]|uniref:Uncharacterized protein LOC115251830 n=1 Tax=Xyrichtys novacula TaxID=13765 RepID=A0AAV1F9G3_XYRNO|nr:uncharacterized protein LOC115251830 [Xyrichtys novacula]
MSLRWGKGYLKEFPALQDESDEDPPAGAADNPRQEPPPPSTFDVAHQASMRQDPFQTLDTKSQTSKSTISSQRSSASSTAVKALLKAKAARAQLVYAEKEANVMKQKADLEASLLQCQKAAAAAEAGANAYEEVERWEKSRIEDEPFNTVQRTSDYVHQQSERILSELPLEHMDRESLEEKADRMEISTVKSALPDTNKNTQPVYKKAKDERTTQSGPAELRPHPRPSRLTSPEKRQPPEPQGAQDLARYLIRKEMVSSGLLKFDDKPENYWSWKASFISTTKDLDLSDREELDLMTKRLGPESSEQAKRIRSVHVLNPRAGVNMVWQRLEEWYGTPEVIEDALYRKIECFPKLNNRDTVKL